VFAVLFRKRWTSARFALTDLSALTDRAEPYFFHLLYYVFLRLAASLACTALVGASPHALPQGVLETTAELVKVDVSVADSRGNYIAGLAQKNFRVLDNGTEQPTTFFLPVDTPAQILVMIETGPAVYLIHNEHLAAAYALLDGLDPGDQIALATYDQAPRRILAFTSDKTALLSAIGGIQYNIGMGELNFYRSLSDVLGWLAPTQGKRAIVLLTTGLDSAQPSHWDALVDKIHRDDIVIFPVALGGALRVPAKPKAPNRKKSRDDQTNSDKASPAASANPVSFARADQDLRALAAMTGGKCYFPESRDDFVSIYRQIAAALRHQYVLGFVPAHDGQYHSLSVELASPNAPLRKPEKGKAAYHIFARTGYLAPAP
jgi:VWFA-related protein